MGRMRDAMMEEMKQWLLEHQYFAEVKSYWWRKSNEGNWIKPFEMAYIHVQQLPGMHQKDRITWITQKEFGRLQLKYGRKLDYRKYK